MTGKDSVIKAFGADHVVRLTGLSKSQLRYWDSTGFFTPRYAFEDRRSPYSRVYSFRDVVGLRTLGVLRNEYKVSLQHLRQVADKLSHLKDVLWSETTLYVLNREVYFREPESGRLRGVVSGQYVTIPLVSIMHDVSQRANRLKERTEDQIGKVERHRYVAHNAWAVAGTRIPTKTILRFKEVGYTTDQIIREYPSLTRQDIEAALAHEERLAKRA